jgi:3-oxocholest-4-en-26-oyl-CoA dehydrogenase alpha subunit
MDFQYDEHHEALRAKIREIITAVVDDDVVAATHASGTNHHGPFAKALGDAGVLAEAMPGPGQDPVAMMMLSGEAQKLDAPFDSIGMALTIAGVLDAVGSDFLKQTVGAGLLSGEETVCFGLTEPDGGSDLAALSTRAVLDGDHWVINGAKMWTTLAHIADWLFILVRTSADMGRYGGFTVFVVPMDTPGITVDPIATMSTERANATFYDDVRVGPEWIVGELHEGWKVLSVMLGFERGMANTGALGPLLKRMAAWAQRNGALDDPLFRDRFAQAAIDAQISELLTQRTVWTAATGQPPGTEGSIAKVFATERYQQHARWAQATAGPEGLLGFGAPDAAAGGWIDHDARHSVPQTFQGGTTEINRNNIAERHLGLPRAR